MEILERRQLLATCHVTRLGDFGAGSDVGGGHFRGDLRYCISKVNSEPGPDIITFSVTGTINLNSALPNLASDIDIQGPGADMLTVRRSTGGAYRIFTVSSGAAVQIGGLTITNGYHTTVGGDGLGGGIHNAGTLTVLDSIIVGNDASSITNNHSGNGGGIYNASTGNLTVINSTITDNLVFGGFFESSLGGGICNDGTASVFGSTIYKNGAGDFETLSAGDGISNGCTVNSDAVLYLINSTVSGNFGTGGGAVYNYGPLTAVSHSTISANGGPGLYIESVSSVFMRNTIVAGNEVGDVFGTLTSSDYNLIGNSQGGSGFSSTDLLDVDPLLSPLDDYGGPTLTHCFSDIGSPAINAGDNTDAPDLDQRGLSRIIDGTIDIGSVEYQGVETDDCGDIGSTRSAFQSSGAADAFVTKVLPFDMKHWMPEASEPVIDPARLLGTAEEKLVIAGSRQLERTSGKTESYFPKPALEWDNQLATPESTAQLSDPTHSKVTPGASSSASNDRAAKRFNDNKVPDLAGKLEVLTEASRLLSPL